MKSFNILIISALVIIMLSSLKCKGGDQPPMVPEKSTGIVLANGSSVRIDPFIFSSRVAELPKGTAVILLERSFEKQGVGSSVDYWYKVRVQNGITGWVYGKNIKIVHTKNTETVKNLIAEFKEEEEEEIKKNLMGKWWSINLFGEFTDHCLEFNEDGKYKSYQKGNDKIIESEYTINFNKNEIVFLQGTSFGKNLDLVIRGNSYTLKKNVNDGEIRFKKIVENRSEIKEEDAPDTKKGKKGDQKKPNVNKAQ